MLGVATCRRVGAMFGKPQQDASMSGSASDASSEVASIPVFSGAKPASILKSSGTHQHGRPSTHRVLAQVARQEHSRCRRGLP